MAHPHINIYILLKLHKASLLLADAVFEFGGASVWLLLFWGGVCVVTLWFRYGSFMFFSFRAECGYFMVPLWFLYGFRDRVRAMARLVVYVRVRVVCVRVAPCVPSRAFA